MAEGGEDNAAIDGQEEYLEWPCKICAEDDLMIEAIAYCKNCDGCFCKSCLQYHDRFQKTHTVLGIKQKVDWGTPKLTQDTDIECSDHPGQTISMYCGQHDDVCCPVCVSIHHTDKCRPDITFIPTIAKGITTGEECSSVITNVDDLLDSFIRLEQKNTDFQKLLNDSQKQCVKGIETFHSELAKHLETLKDASMSNLKRKHNDIKKENQAELQTLVEVKQELQEMKQQLQPTSAVNESLLFVKLQNCKKKLPKISEIATKVSVQEKHTLKFHPNNALLKTVETTASFGTFVDLDTTSSESQPVEKQLKDNHHQQLKHLQGKMKLFSGTYYESQSQSVTKQLKDAHQDLGPPQDKLKRLRGLYESQKKKTIDGQIKEGIQKLKTTDVERKKDMKQKEDDIVFETFYHRSGKHFNCIYQSGMRFYNDDLNKKEWQPFPKRWYNEGLLVTDTILRDDDTGKQ